MWPAHLALARLDGVFGAGPFCRPIWPWPVWPWPVWPRPGPISLSGPIPKIACITYVYPYPYYVYTYPYYVYPYTYFSVPFFSKHVSKNAFF